VPQRQPALSSHAERRGGQRREVVRLRAVAQIVQHEQTVYARDDASLDPTDQFAQARQFGEHQVDRFHLGIVHRSRSVLLCRRSHRSRFNPPTTRASVCASFTNGPSTAERTQAGRAGTVAW
jgi:hypothetical protein